MWCDVWAVLLKYVGEGLNGGGTDALYQFTPLALSFSRGPFRSFLTAFSTTLFIPECRPYPCCAARQTRCSALPLSLRRHPNKPPPSCIHECS